MELTKSAKFLKNEKIQWSTKFSKLDKNYYKKYRVLHNCAGIQLHICAKYLHICAKITYLRRNYISAQK